MTVTELLTELKNFCSARATEVVATDEAYFVPKTFPAMCIDITSSDSIQIALGAVLDDRKRIEITYYDEVPENLDKGPFLQVIENIKQDLMESTLAQNDLLIRGISSRSSPKGFGEGKWFKETIFISGDIEL